MTSWPSRVDSARQMVRSFGFYTNCKAAELRQCHELLGVPQAVATEPTEWPELLKRLGHGEAAQCQVCGQR